MAKSLGDALWLALPVGKRVASGLSDDELQAAAEAVAREALIREVYKTTEGAHAAREAVIKAVKHTLRMWDRHELSVDARNETYLAFVEAMEAARALIAAEKGGEDG